MPTPNEKLFASIIEKDMNGVTEALTEGADVNALSGGGQTPLQVALFYDDTYNIVDTLLEKEGINVNIADESGYTPLHIAVMKRNVRAVKALLQKGALVDVVSLSGSSPLSLSAEERFLNQEIFNVLRGPAGGKRRRSRTNKKTRKANKKRHTASRRIERRRR